jgi:DNA ligase-1
MKLQTLYKRSTTGKTTEWTIEVQGNKFRTITGFTDGLKTTSAWTECNGKNEGKKNGTTAEEQALAEATATHRKRIEHGSFEDIEDIDDKTFYKPMLANKLEDHIDELKFPVLSQPKLDGMRCVIKADGMWTRKGKAIKSAPHVFEDLQPFFKKNPNLILDGELYCDKLANDFNKIISLVRKTKPTKEDIAESKGIIQFHTYDLPSNKGVFTERYGELKKMDLPKSCVVVKTYTLNSKEEIVEQYEKYIEQGYEGQIIRVDALYQNKRTKYLLKDKQFVDDEFTILGVVEGDGNMSGKVGKLQFEIKNKPFDAAVNGDWNYLAKLLKAKNLIGKKATVKYFRLTPAGIPKWGKVIAIRDYE